MHIGILLSLTAPRPGVAVGPPADTAPPVYVASTGNDTTGTGSAAAPYATLAKAATMALAGGTVRLASDITMPATTTYTGLSITKSLTIESSVPGTRRTIDMSAMLTSSTAGGDGIKLTGASSVLRDLRFTAYAPTSGGSPADYCAAVAWGAINGRIERCEFDHIAGRGLTVGEAGNAAGTNIINCDAHHCSDPNSSSPYGNADGFQVYTTSGQTGITFEGCRSWSNSDDGWDFFFCDAPVTLTGCIAFSNGFRADGTTIGGDGAGFKIGGASHNGAHVLTGCLSFRNAGAGYSSNDNTGAISITNCSAIENGVAGNAYPAGFILDGSSTATITRSVKYGAFGDYLGGSVGHTYNSWDTPPGLGAETVAWFGVNGLVATGMDGARGSDGSLPVTTYGLPGIGSALLTAGPSSSYIGWTATATEATATPPAASAAFAFVGAGTVATATSGNITLTEPAGCQAGDILVVPIAYRGSAPFTAPAGWTMIEQQSSGNTDVDQTTNIASAALAYIVRGASEPSLVFTRTAGDVARAAMLAYRPASGTVSVVASSSNTLATAGTAGSTGGLTTDVNGCLLVAALSGADNVAAAVSGFTAATAPTGTSGTSEITSAPSSTAWSLRRGTTTTNGADVSLYVCDAIKATAGATGTISTGSTGVTARHAMAAVAFKAVAIVPVNTAPPVISGGPAVGATLTASAGTWTGDPTPTVTRQWYRNGGVISGATGSTLSTVGYADGDVITLTETATNAVGTASAGSNAIGLTAAASTAGEPVGLLLILTKAA